MSLKWGRERESQRERERERERKIGERGESKREKALNGESFEGPILLQIRDQI